MAKKRQAVSGKRRDKQSSSLKIIERSIKLFKFLWKPKYISASLIIVVVAYAYTQIELQLVLPISSVKIEGEFNYLDKEQLRQHTLPVVDGGFFSVNLPAVRDALINLPWVEDVSVRRQWPDQLLVRVIEKQPVVYWGDDALMSSKGELFVPEKKLDIRLPQLNGPQGQHQAMLKELARMQAWLLETDLQIQHMKLDARRSWTLEMTSGLEIRLGRTQMHERLQRFASVYKDNLQSQTREMKHIDMRYTNGFAVAWKEA